MGFFGTNRERLKVGESGIDLPRRRFVGGAAAVTGAALLSSVPGWASGPDRKISTKERFLLEKFTQLVQNKSSAEAQLKILKSINPKDHINKVDLSLKDLRKFFRTMRPHLNPHLIYILGIEQFINPTLLDGIEIPKHLLKMVAFVESIFNLLPKKQGQDDLLNRAWWASMLAQNILSMFPNYNISEINQESVRNFINFTLRQRESVQQTPIISDRGNILFAGDEYIQKSNQYLPGGIVELIQSRTDPRTGRGNLSMIMDTPIGDSDLGQLTQVLEHNIVNAPAGFSFYPISHTAPINGVHGTGILLSNKERYQWSPDKSAHVLDNIELVEMYSKRYEKNVALVSEDITNRPKIIFSACNPGNADWVMRFYREWNKQITSKYPHALPPIILSEATVGTLVPVQNVKNGLHDPLHSRFASVVLKSENLGQLMTLENFVLLQEISTPNVFVPVNINNKVVPLQVM